MKTKKSITTISTTILLTSLTMLAIQIIDTGNLYQQVYAGPPPTINPGDILVAAEELDGNPGIVIVDPMTGDQTFFFETSESLLELRFDSAGDIIILTDSGVFRMDPLTGDETAIANVDDDLLGSPSDMDLDAAGNILVIDDDGLGNGLIISVDPISGAETLILSDVTITGSTDLVVEPSGDILVLNVEDIFRYDPVLDTLTLFADEVLGGTETLIISDAGDVFTAGADVVKFDSIGNPTTISTGFDQISGMEIESDGNLIVADTDSPSTVYRVDPDDVIADSIVTSDDLLTDAGPSALTISQSLPIDPDTDSDGILNEIDLQPAVFSDGFDDTSIGGTSDGNIVTRGDQVLTISEEVNPSGVKVNADISGGVTSATVEFCSAMSSIDFDPGDESIVTCSSVTVDVISGPLEITFFGTGGTEATTTLTAGNSITFDQDTFSFSAPATNTETVIISVNGVDNSIEPGSTVSVPLQTAHPDSESSSTIKKWADGIGAEPCNDSETFNCVDESIRDDSDYIQTKGLGKNGFDKQFYTISDISDPLTSDGHVLRYTISEADVGLNPVKLDVELRQGLTVIASFHHENLPTGFTLIEQTLTAAQADSISDYSNLELTLNGNCDSTCKNSPGNREKIQVSWIEFAIMETS